MSVFLALVVFGGFLLLKKADTKVYYVPGADKALAIPAPTIPYFDPPTVDKIKKDANSQCQSTACSISIVSLSKVSPRIQQESLYMSEGDLDLYR